MNEAAVLIALLTALDLPEEPGGGPLSVPEDAHLLLTVRSQAVEHHKGQISFPGGMKDEEDQDLLETALREAYEEVGLHRNRVRLIRQLGSVPTATSNFIVTPYVGLVAGAADLLSGSGLSLSAHEIDRVLFVPLAHLRQPGVETFETFERYPGSPKVTLPTYDFQGHRIWGATAVMIHRLLKELA